MIELIGRQAGGFVYCVSVAGVTGARSDLPPGLPDFISKVRRCTALPLVVGFGISRRQPRRPVPDPHNGRAAVERLYVEIMRASDLPTR